MILSEMSKGYVLFLKGEHTFQLSFLVISHYSEIPL